MVRSGSGAIAGNKLSVALDNVYGFWLGPNAALAAMGAMFGALLLFLKALECSSINCEGLDERHQRFGRPYGKFLVWTGMSSWQIAAMDWPELRTLAAQVLIPAASARNEHAGNHEAKLLDPTNWEKRMRKLNADLDHKYAVLGPDSLGIVHGGVAHFISAAKRLKRRAQGIQEAGKPAA